MKRVYNFAAGPSTHPLAVLEQAAAEMCDYEGTGMSVMEMSHRSKPYQAIIDAAEASLRRLMNIPENYKVLFLQGGASLQFDMVPMNLLGVAHDLAYYIVSGSFAKKAAAEAKRFGNVLVSASSQEYQFSFVPETTPDMFKTPADYVHITSNNTIYGTRYANLPETNGIPIVSDMSSCILSEEINVADYGLIYAGAQKNIGPAGLTIVIVREDLIGKKPDIPPMFDYKVYADNGSMYNTPPTYAIYLAGLVFQNLEKNGGVAAVEEVNKKKAALLYDYLDSSKLFKGCARKESRSRMNVTFVTGSEELDKKFCAEAAEAGLVNLKGHRIVGGMRASIYNAMSLEGVQALVEFMEKFEKNN